MSVAVSCRASICCSICVDSPSNQLDWQARVSLRRLRCWLRCHCSKRFRVTRTNQAMGSSGRFRWHAKATNASWTASSAGSPIERAISNRRSAQSSQSSASVVASITDRPGKEQIGRQFGAIYLQGCREPSCVSTNLLFFPESMPIDQRAVPATTWRFDPANGGGADRIEAAWTDICSGLPSAAAISGIDMSVCEPAQRARRFGRGMDLRGIDNGHQLQFISRAVATAGRIDGACFAGDLASLNAPVATVVSPLPFFGAIRCFTKRAFPFWPGLPFCLRLRDRYPPRMREFRHRCRIGKRG